MLGPAVVALLVLSGLVLTVGWGAVAAGGAAALRWDAADAGAAQLARERRLLLAGSALRLALAAQLLSLALFAATVEHLHGLFTGAMCAVGTLEASRFGWPACAAKLGASLLAGLWLVVDRASPDAAATALVRAKYAALLPVAAALSADGVLQARFFADLRPDVVTSCCGVVFDAAGRLGAGLAAVPVGASRAAFFLLLALTAAAGARCLARAGSPAVFSWLSVALGAAAAVAVVTWVAPAWYELPTHRCPFCLLAAAAGRAGWLLYPALGLGVLAGAGSGAVRLARRLDPRGGVRAAAEHRLCRASLAGFLVFTAVAVWPLLTSDFRLEVP
jgi:hypothetical protein